MSIISRATKRIFGRHIYDLAKEILLATISDASEAPLREYIRRRLSHQLTPHTRNRLANDIVGEIERRANTLRKP